MTETDGRAKKKYMVGQKNKPLTFVYIYFQFVFSDTLSLV